MVTSDEALAALADIEEEFAAFCAVQGRVTEADTRAKLIDRILTDVCGWPEAAITREQHIERGYVDYILSLPTRRTIVVEAKREGLPFTIPVGFQRTLKLSGALASDAEVREAISQVRDYCDDAGVRHAIATNGYAWIVFRAIRDDMPWREGKARVFASLPYIKEHFTEFWNLLSHEAVLGGSLEEEFGVPRRPARNLTRVVDRLFNADLPLQRNRLHAQLTPLSRAIFAEIADQAAVEILQSCYVHSASLKIVAADLDTVITDSIPRFLAMEGAEPLRPGPGSGAFDRVITRAMQEPSGELFLILGGIGSGKTTFLKRYYRTVGKDLLDTKTIWFNVDLLKAPLDPLELESFVLRDILSQLRERYVNRAG